MDKDYYISFLNWLKTENRKMWQAIMKGNRKPTNFEYFIKKYSSTFLSENHQ